MEHTMLRTTLLLVFTILTAGAGSNDGRIDLAEFGRVVQYTGDSANVPTGIPLERGPDGWEAWPGPDGQYMIALEFDEPRELAEVSIEFRHAIADRHLIKVQYFKQDWPSGRELDQAAHDASTGEWVTAQADWWAGDRDVNFAFVPYSREQPAEKGPDVSYRRTKRVRFLLGKRDLPPVRYIHAYGPNPPAEGAFDLRFDDSSVLRPPLEATVENGYLIEGTSRTPIINTVLESEPALLRIRYARGDTSTHTRTVVTLRGMDQSTEDPPAVSFTPAEVARQGSLLMPSAGVTITHRGGPVETQPATQAGKRLSSLTQPQGGGEYSSD